MSDLFVYGTLMPGQQRWPLIAAFVDVIGPATTRGSLTATPMGWPAAIFDGPGIVHGVLLRPRDAEAAVRLYEVADREEDEGRLFRRVTVSVELGDERDRAAAYEWNGQRPPAGRRVPDGRWWADA